METKQIITDIQALWNDIENWYENNAPKRLQDLMDGASQEEIRCFETTIGFSLPNDYLASLSIHNGYVDINSYSYISIDESLRKWLSLEMSLLLAFLNLCFKGCNFSRQFLNSLG